MTAPRTLDFLLRQARARIERHEPAAAWTAAQDGAQIIDVRALPDLLVPGSLHIPRTVLEWRLAPDSNWRSPHAPGLDERVIVLCDHGESSSLAAATLVESGSAEPAMWPAVSRRGSRWACRSCPLSARLRGSQG